MLGVESEEWGKLLHDLIHIGSVVLFIVLYLAEIWITGYHIGNYHACIRDLSSTLDVR